MLTTMRTLVRGGRIVTAQQDFVGDILIEGEKIAAIGFLEDIRTDLVVSATGKLVFPGAVDVHTHMDMTFQGALAADDFKSGSIAAAMGGTTTIIDFPIQQRGQDMRASLEEWFKKAEGKTAVDWGFHQMVTDLSGQFLQSMDAEIQQGVTSFKLFMAYPGILMVDDGTILRAMQWAGESGAMIMIHAENGSVIDELVKQAIADGRRDPIYHALTRPAQTEGEATSRAITLAEMAGVPVYIVHVSTADAVEAIRRARDRGLPVYAETCPHYLLLSEDRYQLPGFEGARYVVTPPLRPAEHKDALWDALRSGDLQVVSTDHATFTLKDRYEISGRDFSKVPTGLPGVETRVGLLYHYGVREKRISLNRFVKLIATNPSKIFGLYPRKGDIAPGSDGDLIIFDPDREFTISTETLAGKCDFDPYEGITVRGWPEKVFQRGHMIVDNGKFVGKAGDGQFLRRGEPQALSLS